MNPGPPAPKACPYKEMSYELMLIWDGFDKDSYSFSSIWDSQLRGFSIVKTLFIVEWRARINSFYEYSVYVGG